jgi:hypothetical protein
MKTKNLVIIIILLYSTEIFIGCSSSLHEGETCIRLRGIDSVTYIEYYALWFPNSYSVFDTSGYYVFTNKNDNDNINLKEYELIRKGKTYCLNLFTVDSLVSASLLNNRSGNNVKIIVEPNLILYDKGKIMIKVYFSNDLKGKYVLKGKRE